MLDERGPQALAEIWNDAPRSPHAAPTRWYCPGVPMYATDVRTEGPSRPQHGYLVPARAALLALDHGHVICRARPLERP